MQLLSDQLLLVLNVHIDTYITVLKFLLKPWKHTYPRVGKLTLIEFIMLHHTVKH